MQEYCTFDANFFGKNVTFVASKLSARGQFIFYLWSMSRSFSHNFINTNQHCQNQSCDTIASKRQFAVSQSKDSSTIKNNLALNNDIVNTKAKSIHLK